MVKKGQVVTSGRVISEQTLGFWTDLFEVHNYKLLKGRPIKIFNNLPSGFSRSNVLHELTIIRTFRNRINHNEPVCFAGSAVGFAETLRVYESIFNILSWIDKDLALWASRIDRVNYSIDLAECRINGHSELWFETKWFLKNSFKLIRTRL